MSSTLIFFAVLLGLVIVFTAIITLCALSISSNDSATVNHSTKHQSPSPTTRSERRRVCRSDFPFICNDGSCAWSNRRNVNA